MYATRRLLRAPKGVPTWAQHMAKQPTKAGRLPPQQWANAPDRGHDDIPPPPENSPGPEALGESKLPPTDWKAAAGSAGSESSAWEDIRRREAVAEGARPAPPQQGPYGPKTDRSKGFMDSFRSLSPNQRILIGATLFVFGLGIYAYDNLVKKEEELEVSDDLRERLAKATAVAKTASSEGLKVDDVAAVRQLSAATQEPEMLREAQKAVAAAAERGGKYITDTAQEKERVAEALAGALEHAREEAHEAKTEVKGKLGEAAQQVSAAGQSVAQQAQAAAQQVKGRLDATGQAVADTVDGAVAEADVVAGAVPERTRFFGIRLR